MVTRNKWLEKGLADTATVANNRPMADANDKLQLAVLGQAPVGAETYYLRHAVTGETSGDFDLRPFERPQMPDGRYRVYYRDELGAELRSKGGGPVITDISTATSQEPHETKLAKRTGNAVSMADLARYEREVMATEIEEAHLLAGKKMVLAKDQAETLALLRFYRHEITKQQHGNLLVQNGNAELFNRLQQKTIALMEQSQPVQTAPPPTAWAELASLAREFMPLLLSHYRPPPNNEAELEILRLKAEINKLNRQKRSKRKGAGDGKKPA